MQTNYTQNMAPALPGMLFGIHGSQSVRSCSNNSISRGKQTFTVTAADIATTAVITLPSGTVKTITVNSGAATKTTTELATMLAAAIVADSVLVMEVEASSNAAVVTVEHKIPGAIFTMTAVNGTVAETVSPSSLVSVKFGDGVAFDGDKALKLVASGAKFAGVALREAGMPNDGTTTGWPGGITVPVLTQGEVWVRTMEAVVVGEDAYCSYASGYVGQFRNDNTNALATGGKFTSSASAGELVRLAL